MESILETAIDGIILIDERGMIESINPAAERMFGYSADELLGHNVTMLMPSPAREEHDMYIRRYLETGEAAVIGIGREVEGRRKDGSTFPIELSLSEITEGERLFTGILRDITVRKQAQRELEKNRRVLATLIGNLQGCAYRRQNDRRWTMDFVSEGSQRLVGYGPTDLMRDGDVSFADLIHPDDVEKTYLELQDYLARAEPFTLTYRVLHRSGDLRWIWEHGCPIYGPDGELEALEGLMSDVTERKRLEAELLQAQKMEAIGRLAGGIAHDFNNLLTAIISGCRIAESKISQESPARPVLGEVRREALRGADMTRQLLDFSRKRLYTPRPMYINDVVADAERMLRKLLGEDIDLRVEFAPTDCEVIGDPGQVEQILMNLAVNARDAMPNGGVLEIRVSDQDQPGAPLPDGSYVVLTVIDNGHGMDPQTKQKAFEPFFTTKEPGKGTGLGLSTVFGLVKGFDGEIELESAVGEGTTFRVYLPRGKHAEAEEVLTQEPSEEDMEGTETILLVEDEALVRAGVRHLLKGLGYTVVDAGSPDAALKVLEETGDVDLLLSDIVLPGMSGPDLSRIVQERVPGIKVLFMSGFSSEALVEQGRLESGVPILEKPFQEQDLALRLREQLSDG